MLGGGWTTTSTQFSENASVKLVLEDGEYREAASDQKTHAILTYGPGPRGGFLNFGLDADLNQARVTGRARSRAGVAFRGSPPGYEFWAAGSSGKCTTLINMATAHSECWARPVLLGETAGDAESARLVRRCTGLFGHRGQVPLTSWHAPWLSVRQIAFKTVAK